MQRAYLGTAKPRRIDRYHTLVSFAVAQTHHPDRLSGPDCLRAGHPIGDQSEPLLDAGLALCQGDSTRQEKFE